jgi:hypothetical protein
MGRHQDSPNDRPAPRRAYRHVQAALVDAELTTLGRDH